MREKSRRPVGWLPADMATRPGRVLDLGFFFFWGGGLGFTGPESQKVGTTWI